MNPAEGAQVSPLKLGTIFTGSANPAAKARILPAQGIQPRASPWVPFHPKTKG
jgi:hypothetical protein